MYLLSPTFPLHECRAKCIAPILISSRKVVCISFQKSYHDYVTLTRNFILFTLSILLIGQPVVLCIRALGWQYYNSKSSILNGSTSQFRKSVVKIFVFWPLSFAIAPQACLLSAAAAARTRLYQNLNRSLFLPLLLSKVNKLVKEALRAHFLLSIWSKTKPCGVMLISKPIRTSKATRS